MFVKIHKSYRDVIAICDEELLGKTFNEGKFQLDVKENFFNGERKTPSQIAELLQYGKREDATFNIVGTKATNLALEQGLITKESIKTIQGVPFAMVLL